MVTSMSRLAYQAEYDLLDQAIESERGVQRLFHGEEEGRGNAMNFRVRLHTARDVDRRENRKLYPPEDPMHGQTLYAQITVRNPYWDKNKKVWVLQLVKNQIQSMVIEEIPAFRREISEEKLKQLKEGNDWMELLRTCKSAGLSISETERIAEECGWPKEGVVDWWHEPLGEMA